MTLRDVGMAATMLGALGAAGCNMSMPGVGGGDRPEAAALSPRPAPSSPVRRDELPPPGATQQLAAQTPADGAAAPAEGDGGPLGAIAAAEAALASPSGDTAPSGPAAVQVATVEEAGLPDAAPPAASSVPAAQASVAPARPAVSRGNFVGGWNVSAGGDNCKLFPSLSSWSGGMRASTRGCSSPALKNVSAWQQSGNQVTLMDSNGQPVARLFPAGEKQYNGQTEDGASISVSR